MEQLAEAGSGSEELAEFRTHVARTHARTHAQVHAAVVILMLVLAGTTAAALAAPHD